MAPISNRERLKELLAKHPEPWIIEEEPHDYKDGTTHFIHVVLHKEPKWSPGEKITVEIGHYLTPELAELLLLLRQFALDELG